VAGGDVDGAIAGHADAERLRADGAGHQHALAEVSDSGDFHGEDAQAFGSISGLEEPDALRSDEDLHGTFAK
jgi:hypothetical protein